MNICRFGHVEICFNEIQCPLCEAKEELKKEVQLYKDEINNLIEEYKLKEERF